MILAGIFGAFFIFFVSIGSILSLIGISSSRESVRKIGNIITLVGFLEGVLGFCFIILEAFSGIKLVNYGN